MEDKTIKECSYEKQSNKSCKNCPRKISLFYRCKLLQEVLKEFIL